MRGRSLMYWFEHKMLPRYGEKFRIFLDMGTGRLTGGELYNCAAEIPGRYMCSNIQSVSFQDSTEIQIILRGYEYARKQANT